MTWGARYRRTLEIDATMPLAYSSLATLTAYVLGRPADAVPLLEKAIELDPGNPGNACWLAQIHLDLGDLAAAVLDLKRAPDQGMALYVSALVDREHGKYQAALARYRKANPELFGKGLARVDGSNWRVAIELAPVLQAAGHDDQARVLLDRSEEVIRGLPRLGPKGYGVSDAQIFALRGQKGKALAALRAAEQAGWRGPYWRWWLSRDPGLDSVRNDPSFKAVFADIEGDMARQRAELATRPKDASMDLAPSR